MPLKTRGKKVVSGGSREKVPQASQPLPDWPSLHPLVPEADLALETVLQGQVVLIRNLFTSSLCKKLVTILSSLSLTTTPSQPKEGDALRVNDRIQFDDPAFAEQLFESTALKSLLQGSPERGESGPEDLARHWGGEVCGLNPRIRIYRYGIIHRSSARLACSAG